MGTVRKAISFFQLHGHEPALRQLQGALCPFHDGLARRICPAGSRLRDLRERWRKGKYLADRVCNVAPGTLHLSPKPFEKVVPCNEYSIDSAAVRKIRGLFDQLRADPLIRSDGLIHRSVRDLNIIKDPGLYIFLN